ncbi:MAG: hypothetical protein H0T42_20295 [Deltaproteobacteria bacterium]|nr:hypothetical protein [Deltaproteobacteria bacterium]
MKTLSRVQRGLESLYRVDTGVEVGDYVVGAQVRDDLVDARRPREQLLVVESDGEMNLALYIDPEVIGRLDSRAHDFQDLLFAVEGVSHFIFTVWCAQHDRPVSQVELELQAEVDKYVTCLLITEPEVGRSTALRRRLFGNAEYELDLDDDEHDRYRAANDNAERYAAYLEDAFVARRRIPEMFGELRRFYRHGLAQKLSTIARAA